MTVHASSVIPTWINSWDSAFYTALTSQENDCYTRGGSNTVTNWQPLFNSLVSAITSWKTTNRQSNLVSLLNPLSGYLTMNALYGTDGSLITSAAADQIFTMNGFIAACKGRANSYYNDLVVATPNTSVKISNDITTINGSSSQESTAITNAVSTVQSTVSSQLLKMTFDSTVVPNGTVFGKAQLATKVFTTMSYKKVYQLLNVGTLTLPPGV